MKSSAILAANLRRFRTERGLSQAALAELAGLEMMTVYNYEAENRWPKAASLDALASALGRHSWELLADGSTPTREPTPEEALAVIARDYGLSISAGKS